MKFWNRETSQFLGPLNCIHRWFGHILYTKPLMCNNIQFIVISTVFDQRLSYLLCYRLHCLYTLQTITVVINTFAMLLFKYLTNIYNRLLTLTLYLPVKLVLSLPMEIHFLQFKLSLNPVAQQFQSFKRLVAVELKFYSFRQTDFLCVYHTHMSQYYSIL